MPLMKLWCPLLAVKKKRGPSSKCHPRKKKRRFSHSRMTQEGEREFLQRVRVSLISLFSARFSRKHLVLLSFAPNSCWLVECGNSCHLSCSLSIMLAIHLRLLRFTNAKRRRVCTNRRRLQSNCTGQRRTRGVPLRKWCAMSDAIPQNQRKQRPRGGDHRPPLYPSPVLTELGGKHHKKSKSGPNAKGSAKSTEKGVVIRTEFDDAVPEAPEVAAEPAALNLNDDGNPPEPSSGVCCKCHLDLFINSAPAPARLQQPCVGRGTRGLRHKG